MIIRNMLYGGILSAKLPLALTIAGCLLSIPVLSQTITRESVNFELERTINRLETNLVDKPDTMKNILSRIRTYQNLISAGVDDQDSLFVVSLNGDVKLLKRALQNLNDEKVIIEALIDTEDDLRAKASNDGGFGLSGADFQQVEFSVVTKRIVRTKLEDVSNYYIRASGWGNRFDKMPEYNFNDRPTAPTLQVSLVRGVYAFWLEPVGSKPILPASRKFKRFTVTTNARIASPHPLITP